MHGMSALRGPRLVHDEGTYPPFRQPPPPGDLPGGAEVTFSAVCIRVLRFNHIWTEGNVTK